MLIIRHLGGEEIGASLQGKSLLKNEVRGSSNNGRNEEHHRRSRVAFSHHGRP